MDKLHLLIPPPIDIEALVIANLGFAFKKNKNEILEEIKDLQVFEQIENLDNNVVNIPLFRKSERSRKVIENIVNVINCHQCKKLDTISNILTCGNEQCRESFCLKCIKKYYVSIFYLYKLLA